MDKVRLRPHHLMCLHGFRGRGYSLEYSENFSQLLQVLSTRSQEPLIEVVVGTDSICSPCPHRDGLLCAEEVKVNSLDRAYMNLLGVHHGQRLSLNELRSLVAKNVEDASFQQACQSCQWFELGFCRSALAVLKEESGHSIQS